jgi:hypothetical protein
VFEGEGIGVGEVGGYVHVELGREGHYVHCPGSGCSHLRYCALYSVTGSKVKVLLNLRLSSPSIVIVSALEYCCCLYF